MEKIYIGFSKSKKKFPIFSWAIRAIECTKYSHVYLRRYSKNIDVEYVYQASGTMVNFMHIDTFKSHSEPLEEFEFEISLDVHKKLIKRCMELAGKPYGLSQIWAILMAKLGIRKKNKDVNSEYAWICSEIVVEMLDKSGIINKKDWKKSPDLVTPKDINIMLKSIKK